MSSIYIANMELAYWSVLGNGGGLRGIAILARFLFYLLEIMRIWCKIQVIIYLSIAMMKLFFRIFVMLWEVGRD